MTDELTPTKANDWRNSKVLLVLLLVVLLGLLAFGNWRLGGLFGNWDNSDMLYIWLASDGLLKGVDIYNEADWQALVRSASDEYRSFYIWGYPYPALIIFAPLALLPLDISGTIWLLLLEFAYAVSAWWFISQTPSAQRFPLFPVLVLALALSPPFLLIIHFGQYGVLMLFFLVLAVGLIEKDQPMTDILAGLYLSLQMFRPNPVIALIPVIGLWLLWRRRWWVIAGGVMSTAFLIGWAWLLRPNWIQVWLSYIVGGDGRIESFGIYTASLLGAVSGLFPELDGNGRAVVMGGVVLAVLCLAGWVVWRGRVTQLPALVALFCAVSLVVTTYAQPYDHILLVFTVLWAIQHSEDRSQAIRLAVWGLGLGIIVVVPAAIKVIVDDVFMESRLEYSVAALGFFYAVWAMFALQDDHATGGEVATSDA